MGGSWRQTQLRTTDVQDTQTSVSYEERPPLLMLGPASCEISFPKLVNIVGSDRWSWTEMLPENVHVDVVEMLGHAALRVPGLDSVLRGKASGLETWLLKAAIKRVVHWTVAADCPLQSSEQVLGHFNLVQWNECHQLLLLVKIMTTQTQTSAKQLTSHNILTSSQSNLVRVHVTWSRCSTVRCSLNGGCWTYK